MIRTGTKAGCSLLGLLLLLPAWAQRRHDPLTPAEINQLRDTAQDPDPRLKLYLQFARTRLASVEQVHSDPKITDRGQEIHERLQDFVEVYDELDDNIATFVERKEDLRKVLKNVIEADNEFQARLRALKDSGDATKAEAAKYEFLLSETLHTLATSADDHRQLLAEQEAAAKHKRKSP
jgi:hypothetical protein